MGSSGAQLVFASEFPSPDQCTFKSLFYSNPIDHDRFDFKPCFSLALYIPIVILFALSSSVSLAQFSQKDSLGFKGRYRQGVRSLVLYWGKLVVGVEVVAVQLAIWALSIGQARKGGTAAWANLALVFGWMLCLPLSHYAHLRTRRSSTSLLMFYLFLLVLDAIRLRTLIELAVPRSSTLPFVLYSVRVGLTLLAFALECAGPESQASSYSMDKTRLPSSDSDDSALLDTDEDDGSERVECPIARANIFSRLTFSWMTPMMKLGYRKFLTEQDLWALPPSDQADTVGARMQAKWEAQLRAAQASDGKKQPSLIWAIVKAFGGPYAVAGGLKLAQDCLQFLQPQLLKRLLSFVDTYRSITPEEREPARNGYIIAVTMFVCAMVQTAFLHQYFKRVFETGMRVRGGLISLVYAKSLVLSNEERQGRATGDVTNLMSTDISRLQDCCAYGLIAVSGIFQIILAFVSLYGLLGWSMLAGVFVMLFAIPINMFLARLQSRLNKQQMTNKDKRTRLMQEILSNIRSIKLYAWEGAFARKLFGVRNGMEMKLLKQMGYVSSVASFLWSFTPFLVALSSFAVFVATSSKPLTPAIVFTALSLFQLLQFPLNALPVVINNWVEGYVSIGRLWSFLAGKELQRDASIREEMAGNAKIGDELVTVEQADFAWSPSALELSLRDINLHLKKGDLLACVGQVGSGKSSLLAGILGEMSRLRGRVVVRGKVAYAAQSPWLLSATVKENIIFGHRWDPEFYLTTLEACALVDDLAVLKDGDQTQVGERGITLSGGQKARISVARAVYARADVYLLDDVLSAVDAHVARHLFDKVIGPEGLLRSKARLLCTNAIPFCQQADELIMLRRGVIVERGNYASVLEANKDLKKLLAEFGKRSIEEEDSGSSDRSSATPVDPNGYDESRPGSGAATPSGEVGVLKRRISAATVRRASVIPTAQQKKEALMTLKRSTRPKESMATGSVKRHIYGKYIRANGFVGVFIYLFTILLQQGFSVATNFWLKAWSSHNTSQKNGENSSLPFYLGGYAFLGFCASFTLFINNIFLYATCVVRSATKLHDSMFNAVLRSPMSFFEQTPIGTILNRFSRDVYVIDGVLARVFGGFFRTMSGVIAVIMVISWSVPPFLIVCIPMFGIYKIIQSYYLATSRELKRLDSVSKSPIFASFGETLSGVSTIRAYAQQARFITENEARVDRNQEAYFPSISCNRWLAVRLELIGSVLIVAAAFLSVFELTHSERLDAGLVGILMSYALSMTQTLNWVVRSATEVETNIVSVERVVEYTELPPEAPLEIPDHAPSEDWPTKGCIEFKNYAARYRPELDLVLRDVTFDIKPGEKVGIVGRTGAGKSSVTMGLYRVIEPAGGKIEIDGVDITKIGLRDLRSRLSILPQDAQCFEGTMRDNLDPEGRATDEELWRVLEHARLKEHVRIMEGGLDARVEEGGSNLSVGQRQLMCLARAMLRRTKILIMDEATSSVDPESDREVQVVIRTEFKDASLLVIAHRLNTIIDCDRILVLSAGRVAEFDTPDRLLERPDSIFASMCKEAGVTPEPKQP